MFERAALLSHFLGRPVTATNIYKEIINKYPESIYADDSHYNLGLIACDNRNLEYAVMHFTSIITNYPDSYQIENAKFMAKKVSEMLVKKDEDSENAMITSSLIKSILPNNLISIIAFFSAMGAPLIWIIIGMSNSAGKKSFSKTPKRIWLMLVIFIFLTALNFYINNKKQHLEYNKILNILKQGDVLKSSD